MIPGSANPLLLASAAAAGGYQVERSLRFNSSDSGFCSRTPAVAGNRNLWTLAFWIKRCKFGTAQDVFSVGTSGTDILYFDSSDRLCLDRPGATVLVTTQVFRDPSAWYHIALRIDSTNGTNANKAQLYVNGSEVTTFSTDNRSGLTSSSFLTNTAILHTFGIRSSNTSTNPCDIYLADIYMVDGSSLAPSSFTEVSATTGQLIPLAFLGSYGTNGFYLQFADNSSNTAATLGKDTSGNSNNWTPNNFSVVAGGPTTITTPASNAPPTVDCLVIAGGGGGSGGGGGAGGYLEQTGRTVNAGTSYSIAIGEGSSGGFAQSDRLNGGNSVFDTIIALGGGGGGKDNSTGQSGGSGSGGGATNTGNYSGGAATQGNSGGATGYGFAGGNAPNSSGPYPAAGGGGAGAVGASPSANAATSGDGGAGRASSITGTSVTRGGGGGGGTSSTANPGAGGSGGGGGGATAGTANTGGGGGGGSSLVSGGAGGSGIVIIRYANTYDDLTVGGGLTYTYANTGGYKIYSFTASATAAQAAGNDSLVDTPTSYGTPDTGVGGEVRGNYATSNPLDNGGQTLANGNLDITGIASNWRGTRGTIGMSSGKWYWEVTISFTNSGSNQSLLGIATNAASISGNYASAGAYGWEYYSSNGNKFNNGSNPGYGASYTSGDVIGIAFDADSGALTFYKNGSSQGTAYTGLTSGPYFPSFSLYGTSLVSFNAGQRAFAYTAPSGFKALCDTNITEGTITTSGTFTGNASANGPFVYLNGVPTAMTINSNAVTFATHADKLSNGFKLRTSSGSYNTAGSNSYSITTTGAKFKYARAQPNP
jgi:hypothetical protein